MNTQKTKKAVSNNELSVQIGDLTALLGKFIFDTNTRMNIIEDNLVIIKSQSISKCECHDATNDIQMLQDLIQDQTVLIQQQTVSISEQNDNNNDKFKLISDTLVALIGTSDDIDENLSKIIEDLAINNQESFLIEIKEDISLFGATVLNIELLAVDVIIMLEKQNAQIEKHKELKEKIILAKIDEENLIVEQATIDLENSNTPEHINLVEMMNDKNSYFGLNRVDKYNVFLTEKNFEDFTEEFIFLERGLVKEYFAKVIGKSIKQLSDYKKKYSAIAGLTTGTRTGTIIVNESTLIPTYTINDTKDYDLEKMKFSKTADNIILQKKIITLNSILTHNLSFIENKRLELLGPTVSVDRKKITLKNVVETRRKLGLPGDESDDDDDDDDDDE